MKTTIHHVIADGRLVGDHHRPLHVRLDLEAGKLCKVTLGVEQREGVVSWQLSVLPAAVSLMAYYIEEALTAAASSPIAPTNPLERQEGGD